MTRLENVELVGRSFQLRTKLDPQVLAAAVSRVEDALTQQTCTDSRDRQALALLTLAIELVETEQQQQDLQQQLGQARQERDQLISEISDRVGAMVDRVESRL